MVIRWFIFLLVFLAFIENTFSQNDNSLWEFQKNYYEDKSTIPSDILVGYWNTKDSIPSRILFEQKPHEVYCFYRSYQAHSFTKDSLGNVGVLGILMHWPPNYCHLQLINETTIELTFFEMARVMDKRTFYRDPYQGE